MVVGTTELAWPTLKHVCFPRGLVDESVLDLILNGLLKPTDQYLPSLTYIFSCCPACDYGVLGVSVSLGRRLCLRDDVAVFWGTHGRLCDSSDALRG